MKLAVTAITVLCFGQSWASLPPKPDPKLRLERLKAVPSILASARANLELINDNVKLIEKYGFLIGSRAIAGAFFGNEVSVFMDLFMLLDTLSTGRGPKGAKSYDAQDLFPIGGRGCGVAQCRIQPVDTCSTPGCRPDCAYALVEAASCGLKSIEGILQSVGNLQDIQPTQILEIQSIVFGTLEAYLVIGAYLDACVLQQGFLKQKEGSNPFNPLFLSQFLIRALGPFSIYGEGVIFVTNVAREANPLLFEYFATPEEEIPFEPLP